MFRADGFWGYRGFKLFGFKRFGAFSWLGFGVFFGFNDTVPRPVQTACAAVQSQEQLRV